MQVELVELTTAGPAPISAAVERCQQGRQDPSVGTCEPAEARQCVAGWVAEAKSDIARHCPMHGIFYGKNWPETQRRYLDREPTDGMKQANSGYAAHTGDEKYAGGEVKL